LRRPRGPAYPEAPPWPLGIAIIGFTNGYHGVTLGALAPATGQQRRARASLTQASRAPFDGEGAGIDAPAAILLETVQGEGGLNVASSKWVRRIAALAQKLGALFIVDDVQAGCGRTGTFFSFERMGVMPDLVVLSKSLSGFGLPMAILMIRPKHDVWQPAEHNGSFRGNNHAFVTASATLEVVVAPALRAADLRTQRIVKLRLHEIGALIPGASVKGRGMMQGLAGGSSDLADPRAGLAHPGGRGAPGGGDRAGGGVRLRRFAKRAGGACPCVAFC
jgi:diaminobutyrate-2-oxoglutarate transaminase